MAAILALVTALVLVGTSATAGVWFPEDRELLNVNLQNSFRSWTIEDKESGEEATIRQYAARLMASVDVLENVDLVVYGAGGFSQDRRAAVSEIAGLADTKLKAYGYLWEQRLVLSAGVNMPTGMTGLDDEEIRAVQAISPTVLGFRMKNYGSGTDLDLAAALGYDLRRDLTVGGGVSYLVKGEYDLDEATTYAPGDEFAVTAGVDWRRDQWTLSVDGLYRHFGKDDFAGLGTFQDGAQLETTLRVAWRREQWGVEASLRHINKDDGEFAIDLPASDTRVENGNNLWFTLTPTWRPHEAIAVEGLIEYTSVEQSQQQDVGAWTAGFGAGVSVRLTPYTLLDLRAIRLTGASEDDAIDLSGYDGMVTVRWQY